MSDELLSGLITAMLAALAIGLSVKIHNDGNTDRRRQNTVMFWQLWSSEYLRRCRSFVFNLYNGERARCADGERVAYSKIKDIPRTTDGPLIATEAIGTVVHFYISLDEMLCNDQVDEVLAKNLFAEDAADWARIFEDVDWSGGNTEFYLDRGKEAIRRVAKLDPHPDRRMSVWRRGRRRKA